MNTKRWLLRILLALPLTAAGLVYGQTLIKVKEPQKSAGYVCPLTGEELPCPKCCPLNGQR
jgi:uncharacterized membrane protein